jgi:hypothetical protein
MSRPNLSAEASWPGFLRCVAVLVAAASLDDISVNDVDDMVFEIPEALRRAVP